MAGSINKVILVGNLGADPKVSNTAGRLQNREFEHCNLGQLDRQSLPGRAQRAHRMAPRCDF